MEAKNLRIGNLVGIEETALHADGCNHLEAIFEIEELRKDVAHFKGFNIGEYYKDLKGVKLNDGLLFLYGFKRDGLGNMWIDLITHWLSLRFADGFYHPLYAQIPETSHEDEQRVSINRIEFVHELQNLFFALTGKELETKIGRFCQCGKPSAIRLCEGVETCIQCGQVLMDEYKRSF